METVYQRYADQVKRFLCASPGTRPGREDLTQETFYRAVKSISRYDGTCKLSVWLCQIAKHCWYDSLKHKRRHPAVSMGGPDPAGEDPAGAQEALPEISLLGREDYLSIHKAHTPSDSPMARSFSCGCCRT